MKSKKGPKRPDSAAAERLQNAIADGTLFHAYLLEGSRGNNENLVQWFTKAALCERKDGTICGGCSSCRQIQDGLSPYVITVRSEAEKESADERFQKKLTASDTEAAPRTTARKKASASNTSIKIKDNQIEEVIRRSLQTTLTNDRLFMVIDRAETITPKGQNRLLKILEEPPAGMILVLMTSNSEAVLDTIRSRCVHLRTDLRSDKMTAPGKPAFQKRVVRTSCDLLRGMPAFKLWKEFDYFAGSREKAIDFCTVAQLFFRDVMLYPDPAVRALLVFKDYEEVVAEAAAAADPEVVRFAIRECEAALRDLDANVSMKHALRSLLFRVQLSMEQTGL